MKTLTTVVLIALLVACVTIQTGVCFVQETIPESGSTVTGSEGERVTFYCRVLNEANGTQVVTEWFIQRRDAGSPQTIVHDPDSNFNITGEPLPNPVIAGQTYETNLTILRLTVDLDRANLSCGRGGTPPTIDASFILRVYSQCSGNFSARGGNYQASYVVQGNNVTFSVSARITGWVAIGVSNNNRMPNTDVIVGAADGTGFFVDDRFASGYFEPPVDSSQDITNAVARVENGVITMNFTRPRNSGDSADISLDQCRFLLYAYGTSATVSSRTITYHGNTRGVLSESFCIPSANVCPAPTPGPPTTPPPTTPPPTTPPPTTPPPTTPPPTTPPLCPSVCFVQETIPESGSTVTGSEGERVTFYCRVLNETNGTQVATEWFIQRIGAGSPRTIVRTQTNFNITGEPLPNPVVTGQTYQTNLTILSLTSDLDRANLSCGRGGTPPTIDASFILRVYPRCSGNFSARGGNYQASYVVQGNNVTFSVSARITGWVAIGVSNDSRMPNTDVIVGAADGTGFFVDDRFASGYFQPPVDSSQDIANTVATVENGVITMNFTRPRNSGDSMDISLDQCRFLLYAYGSSATISSRTITYHGNTRGVLSESFCIPSANVCPAPTPGPPATPPPTTPPPTTPPPTTPPPTTPPPTTPPPTTPPPTTPPPTTPPPTTPPPTTPPPTTPPPTTPPPTTPPPPPTTPPPTTPPPTTPPPTTPPPTTPPPTTPPPTTPPPPPTTPPPTTPPPTTPPPTTPPPTTPPPTTPPEDTCTVDDLLAQALAASPNNFLPRPGICGIIRPEPRAYRQQSNRNGTVLFFSNIQNQLNAPFCLAVIVRPMTEPTMLYIYQNTLTPVGLLTIDSDNIVFNLNGNSANLFGNFSGFNQIQLCANGTHMNLYIGCRFSMSMRFSAPGVSENATLSLFTPLFASTPQFDGRFQQLYISSCPGTVPIQTQVNAQCISQPADCTLPYIPITDVFQALSTPSPTTTTPTEVPTQGAVDVWISFGGTIYRNNSNVSLEEIGEFGDSLICVTEQTACCRSSDSPSRIALGNWSFPNGTIVPSASARWDFYTNRGPSVVRLQRLRGGVVGRYRCDIPDSLGVLQSIYIGVYTAPCSGNLSAQSGNYQASYIVQGSNVLFSISARTEGWVGIGVSDDRIMPGTDIVVGAADGTGFFVDDRYATLWALPPVDSSQDITNAVATIENGVMTVNFTRPCSSGDSRDISLDECRFLLYAYGKSATIANRTIEKHEKNTRGVLTQRFCIPCANNCPAPPTQPTPTQPTPTPAVDCGPLNNPSNGRVNHTAGTTLGQTATYSCNTGYNLVGDNTRTCQATGTWSGSAPTCQSQCFGNFSARGGNYQASYVVQGNDVTFSVSARTTGWVAIGVSNDSRMPNTDVIVGAADGTGFFVDDRFASGYFQPPVDSSQDITNAVARVENGVITMNFTRPRNSGDSADISLDQCRFLLYAYGSSPSISSRTITYHGNTRGVLSTSFCIPSSNICPAPTPGVRIRFLRNMTSSVEGGRVRIIFGRNGYSFGDIFVRITPLTYDQFEARGYDLDNFFPNRPPAASISDINTTVITDYIQAGFSLYNLPTFIPIPDDTILETSEGYVYLLEVIEPIHPRDVGRIDNTTNVLLVTINGTDGRVQITMAPREVVITEGETISLTFTRNGFSYGSTPLRLLLLTYDEYRARGFNLDDNYPMRPIPADAGVDFNTSVFERSFGKSEELIRMSFSTNNDSLPELTEGFLCYLEVMEDQLHPRDVGRIDFFNRLVLVRILDNDAPVSCTSAVEENTATIDCTGIDELPTDSNISCTIDGEPTGCTFPFRIDVSHFHGGQPQHQVRVMTQSPGDPQRQMVGGAQFIVPELTLSFVDNTPLLNVDTLTAQFVANRPGMEIYCYFTIPGSARVNCSSGFVRYTDISPGVYKLRVVAWDPVRNEKAVIRNRILVHRDDTFCAAVKTNNGLTIGRNNNVTVEFSGTGRTTGFQCILDKQRPYFECESPLMLANLSVGTHHLKIIPQGCGRQYRAYPFKFTIN